MLCLLQQTLAGAIPFVQGLYAYFQSVSAVLERLHNFMSTIKSSDGNPPFLCVLRRVRLFCFNWKLKKMQQKSPLQKQRGLLHFPDDSDLFFLYLLFCDLLITPLTWQRLHDGGEKILLLIRRLDVVSAVFIEQIAYIFRLAEVRMCHGRRIIGELFFAFFQQNHRLRSKFPRFFRKLCTNCKKCGAG